MQEKECKHNYIGTYPSMKAECTLCGKKFEEPKEGTEKWEDKDSWCVSFVADCLIAGGEKGITRDLSYLTEELRKRINEIVLSEKAESFREGQMSGGLNAFPICLEEIEEAKKQARKEVLEELEKKIYEKYGRDGGAALVIVENTESGVSQRPGHEEVKELISHLK